jgi:hypothetical protein
MNQDAARQSRLRTAKIQHQKKQQKISIPSETGSEPSRVQVGITVDAIVAAIFIGPGSITSDHGRVHGRLGPKLTRCSTRQPNGNRGVEIIFPVSDTAHFGRSQ